MAGAELRHVTEPRKDIQVTGKDSDLKESNLQETWFHIIIILHDKSTDTKFGVFLNVLVKNKS